MGWQFPWYSSHDTNFNQDFGATVGDSEHHRLSVFLRDGEDIYLTYQTSDRGTENLGTAFSLLDLVPYGRQERWQQAPSGWPQGDPYVWWRRQDEDATAVPAPSEQCRSGAHFLLIYALVVYYIEKRLQLRTKHLSLAKSAAERGELLLGGAL